jgi:hypothetical protein
MGTLLLREWVFKATPLPLVSQKIYPVPLVKEAGWVPRRIQKDTKNIAPNEIRSPDRPGRTESLYRLSYRSPCKAVRGRENRAPNIFTPGTR